MYKYIIALIDYITGFDFAKELKKIYEFDNFSRDEIEEYQKKKFKVLKKAAIKSQFYKGFGQADLKDFPIVDRHTMMKDFSKFRTNIRKPYKIISTSGSSGEPFTFYLSKEMLLAKRTSHQKMLEWYGIKRESREMKIGGAPIGGWTKFYYFLKNKRFRDTFTLNEDFLIKIINKINRFKPVLLVGYPSALATLCHYVKSKNIKLFQPKLIVTNAENLYEEYKNCILKVFLDTAIVNQYWATEANLGVTCPEGNIHVDEDTVICEVINADETGVGELVITNLYSFDFPLIRYNIKDKVKISDKLCPCGRKTKIFEKIEGRSNDYCLLKNGKRIYYADDFGVTRNYVDNILKYQFIYYSKSDKLVLNYVKMDKKKNINKDGISHYYNKFYDINVFFNEVNELENEKSGKFKPYKTIDS